METIRTLQEARLDACYAIRLHELHRRLYRRCRTAITIIVMVGGSAALFSMISDNLALLRIGALVVAMTSFLDLVIDFAGKAAERTLTIARYTELLCGEKTLAQFDDGLLRLRSGSPGAEIESLRLVAFNDNVRSSGHESWARPERGLQRFWRAVA